MSESLEEKAESAPKPIEENDWYTGIRSMLKYNSRMMHKYELKLQEFQEQQEKVLAIINDVQYYASNGYRVRFNFDEETGAYGYTVEKKKPLGFERNEKA